MHEVLGAVDDSLRAAAQRAGGTSKLRFGGTTTTPAADEKAPWHFKLMVVALVVYLVWRFYEMFSPT